MITDRTLPAGLDDRSVEYFALNNEPMALYDKRIISFWSLPQHIIESQRKFMNRMPTLQKYFRLDRIQDDNERLARFMILVFGKFDNKPDYKEGEINPELDLEMAAIAYRLGKREIEIIKLIAKGYTDRDIGDTLFISPSTVANHRHNIHLKIKTHNAVELTRFACETHIV